jgi:glycine dehydrogenase subunit 1
MDVHPYIPNSVPGVKTSMLEAIGADSVEELFEDVPASLRLPAPLRMDPPLRSEAELARHFERVLAANTSTKEFVSFLGGGCYPHYVPAVCDEVNSRSEFLTAYAGEPYEDHGRFQALFEYASMLGELLDMDVVNVPTYDGFQASATSIRMAARITGRRRVLISSATSPDKRAKIRDYAKPDLVIEEVPFDVKTGQLGVDAVRSRLGDDVACVYFDQPNWLGIVEECAPGLSAVAHEAEALVVAGVDPSTLGVLQPPASWGADIACGDIQPLGMHQSFGGGQAGFIATHDDPRYVSEFPSRLFGIAPTIVQGEYGFGDVAYERTSFAVREEGKEWVGTAAALWGITAGVYLALMGPAGMRELGRTMMTGTRYAMDVLAHVPGIRVPYRDRHHVKEFVVDLSESGKRVENVNRRLLDHRILGGVDLSRDFPELGQSLLFCVTEVHRAEDIDLLASALKEILG